MTREGEGRKGQGMNELLFSATLLILKLMFLPSKFVLTLVDLPLLIALNNVSHSGYS